MVKLTTTASIVEAYQQLDETEAEHPKTQNTDDGKVSQAPEIGGAITHVEVIELWKRARSAGLQDVTLENLLRGAQVYVPPPPPKPEPTPEYKALMARLRRDEEEQKYQRMVQQTTRMDAFAEQFPGALSQVQAYAEVNRPVHKSDEGDDDVTYADVQRQLMLILNFLVSIIGVAATIWVAARWWSLPARLFTTLGGAIIVAIAEVAVYSGYVWRMEDSKTRQKQEKEVKEVVQSWIVGDEKSSRETPVAQDENVIVLDTKSPETEDGIRRRLKGEQKT